MKKTVSPTTIIVVIVVLILVIAGLYWWGTERRKEPQQPIPGVTAPATGQKGPVTTMPTEVGGKAKVPPGVMVHPTGKSPLSK